jgi:hypothetical protein
MVKDFISVILMPAGPVDVVKVLRCKLFVIKNSSLSDQTERLFIFIAVSLMLQVLPEAAEVGEELFSFHPLLQLVVEVWL